MTSPSSPSERIIPISILEEEEEKGDGDGAKKGHENNEEEKADIKEAEVGGERPIPEIKGGGGEEKEEALDKEEIKSGSVERKDSEKEKEAAGAATAATVAAAATAKVRLVPIKLPDGTLLQRDPDESMEIRTEFTDYRHQQFADDHASPSAAAAAATASEKGGQKVEKSERLVPIRLEESGEDLVPTFSRLEDIDIPAWSSFKNRGKGGEEGGGGVAGVMEGVAVEDKDGKEKEKKATKSSEKKVQHSVRFEDDDDDGDDGDGEEEGQVERRRRRRGKRSSSLDSSKKQQQQQQQRQRMQKPARERHRSSPGTTTTGTTGMATKKTSPERTLNEIDQDINKIWKELQELDSLPPSGGRDRGGARQTSLNGLPRRGSPARGVQSATPVKIRTFTTPAPTSVVTSYGATSSARRTIFDQSPTQPQSQPQTNAAPSKSPPPLPATNAAPHSHPPKSYYTPQRALEPTRPGSIVPVSAPAQRQSTQRAANSTPPPQQQPQPPPPPPVTVLQQQQQQQQQEPQQQSQEQQHEQHQVLVDKACQTDEGGDEDDESDSAGANKRRRKCSVQ